MGLTVVVTRDVGGDPGVALPDYATAGSAGADLRANLSDAQRATGIVLQPLARALIPTGLRIAVPEGYEMQIRPRSGLALRHGVTVANAPGTVDSDYRGPVGVLLINLGTEPFVVRHGERIAQAVVAPLVRAAFAEGVAGVTMRGAGGFGSTGQD